MWTGRTERIIKECACEQEAIAAAEKTYVRDILDNRDCPIYLYLSSAKQALKEHNLKKTLQP